MDNLMNVVKSNFAPVVLVICSPDAEEVLKRSETTLLKLLNRYNFTNQLIKVRTIGDQTYDFKGFQVRFTSLSDLENRCSPPAQQDEQATKYLSQVASYHGSDKIYADFRFSEKESIPAFQKALLKDSTPWYTYYRWEYLRSMGITNFECFEHPVACLLVVSSENENPGEALVNMYDEKNPPAAFRSGIIDPNISKYYVLLHDAQKGDASLADRKLAQMRITFEKSKCSFLKVNSAKDKSSVSNPTLGSLLTNEDLQGIESFTREFVFKSIIPQMERSIRSMNELVDATRKGISNKLNRWLGFGKKQQPGTPGKTGAITPSASGNSTPLSASNLTGSQIEGSDPGVQGANMYPLGSIENIQKKLADYLFMLQDYQEALNMYKNASKDYVNDKSWKHYAASNEMSGLCIFLMDPMKKDLESFLDNAYTFYARDGVNRHIIRATIFFADILRMRKNYSDAAQKFIRAAERESERDRLCSAMLQEQASFCMLLSTPSQFRKYAFRLILAGHLFNSTQQVKHSFRCYSSAYYLYKSKNWFLIDDHIHFTLSRQSFLMGKVDQAVHYINELLAKNYQSPQKQSSYLREFVHILQKYQQEKQEKLPLLPLPHIQNDSITVFLRDFPPKSPLQDMWKRMCRSLKEDEQQLSHLSRAKLRLRVKERKNKPRLSALGEPIFIEVEVRNPLQIPLQFVDMQLVGSHSLTLQTDEAPPMSPTFDNKEHAGEVDLSLKENVPQLKIEENDSFSVTPFDLLMEANETRKLRLCITPKKEGILAISGLGFSICGVYGETRFNLPKRRLNETANHRKGVFYQPNLDLTIRITRPMPLLDVEIQRWPTHLLQGQIEKVNVLFKNSGTSALKNVKVKMSEPMFFTLAEGDEGRTADFALKNKDTSITQIPIDSLAPGSSVVIPMWIRGAKVGSFNFHFLFWYISELADSEMKYRLQRLSKQSRVLPSLKVSETSTLSYSNINAYLLNLEVSNAQTGNAEFKIKHVMSVSPSWKIQPLSHKSNNSASKPLNVSNSITSSLSGSASTPLSTSLSASSDTPSVVQSPYTITAEQTTNLFFRIVPVTPEQTSIQKNEKTNFYHTSISLSDGPLNTAVTRQRSESATGSRRNSLTLNNYQHNGKLFPSYDFLLREKNEDSHKIVEYGSLISASLATTKQAEEKTVIDSNSFDLIILWETTIESGEKITLQGQHNLCNISFLAQTTVDKAIKEDTALRFSIESPAKIVHDFSKESVCIVPILFHVNNVSTTAPLSFFLETLQPHEHMEVNSALGSQKRSQYFWSETTQHSVSDLKPEEKIALETCVCFTRPGVYNLNRYKFSLKDEKSAIKQQIYSPFQHMIMIEDKNELP